MIDEEVTTNVTAPMILARLFMPHLIKVGGTFMITSSGLAFVPMGVYPTCEFTSLSPDHHANIKSQTDPLKLPSTPTWSASANN
jgi:short-subunit dehydrogenase involved in D-alanine esterification of teichoic acids